MTAPGGAYDPIDLTIMSVVHDWLWRDLEDIAAAAAAAGDVTRPGRPRSQEPGGPAVSGAGPSGPLPGRRCTPGPLAAAVREVFGDPADTHPHPAGPAGPPHPAGTAPPAGLSGPAHPGRPAGPGHLAGPAGWGRAVRAAGAGAAAWAVCRGAGARAGARSGGREHGPGGTGQQPAVSRGRNGLRCPGPFVPGDNDGFH